MEPDDPQKANLISTLIFVSGIVTLLQSTLGTRLPIIQGGSFSFLIPSLAILSLPEWECPVTLEGLTDEEKAELWQARIREIQGAIIVSAAFELLFGLFGNILIQMKVRAGLDRFRIQHHHC
jgi:nucleobase transporter 1/2